MLDWLLDNSLVLTIVLAGSLLAVLYFWWQKRQRGYLIAAGVLAGLFVLLNLLSFFVVTDSRRIERAIGEMRQGVIDGDVDRIFRHISDSFRYNKHDKRAFRERSESVLRSQQVKDVIVWNFSPVEISRDKRIAVVEFNVRAVGGWDDRPFYLCRAEFVLDPDGQWRMKTFRVSNPFVETSQPLDIPGLGAP